MSILWKRLKLLGLIVGSWWFDGLGKWSNDGANSGFFHLGSLALSLKPFSIPTLLLTKELS